MRLLVFILLFFFLHKAQAQTYVFAQLTGTPVNTTGWNMQGAAALGNVQYTGNSEIILNPITLNQSGAIFYNQPINLSQCTRWNVEFDFYIGGGNMADGLAFCFLDVPPVGFVSGGGLGIPGTANGLKVVFDTYNNCGDGNPMPKIELRWGFGYSECWAQPTRLNVNGDLNFIRSSTYNHARIEYDNGNIVVKVNGTTYLTGFQTFNFPGYFGFTSSVGGLNDLHAIRNVTIYTNMPQSEGGPNKTICTGGSVSIGAAPNAIYNYQWSPASGLSATNVSNPTVTLTNNGNTPVTQTYYVSTSFQDGTGCPTVDSVKVTVLPLPSLAITASSQTACAGSLITFNTSTQNSGTNPVFNWTINGIPQNINSSSLIIGTLNNGDIVQSSLTMPTCPTATSNAITVNIQPLVTPDVTIVANKTFACKDSSVQFTATGSPQPLTYQWLLNGSSVGSNGQTSSSYTLNNGDIVQCVITSTAACLTKATDTSNAIVMTIETPPQTTLPSSASFCTGASTTLDASAGFNSWSWNNGATTGAISVTTAGSYSVTAVTAGGCARKDTVSVFVNALPQPNLPADRALCRDSVLTISPGNFSSYLWTDGTGGPSKIVTAPGNYGVTVIDNNGCQNSDNMTITGFIDNPKDFLPIDTAICNYETLRVDPLQSFSLYSWSTGDNLPYLMVTKPGTYYLVARDANGCAGRDSIVVGAKDCPNGFYVPNAFTPNGDGKNDAFRPIVFGRLEKYRFTVFNRWGGVVFVTTDPSKGWSGNVQGGGQETNVFVWICSYKLAGDIERVEKGTVTLIR